jgi:prevent-host-death family protein
MENCRTYTATEARENLSEVINKALYKGPVVIHRHNDAVAVVSMELLSRICEFEAKLETEAAREALREFDESGGISLAQLKKELGF